MSDNLPLLQGSGAQLSTNEISGVHVLRVKVQTGGDGSATDVSTDSPMPVRVVGQFQGVSLSGALPEGTNAIGSVSVSALPGVTIDSMPSVTVGGSLPAGVNRIGSVDISSLPALPAGSNAIGAVSVSSMPNVTIGSALPAGVNRIGSVDVSSLPALPAGSNAIGSVSVSALPNVTIGAALPAGNNLVGSVDVSSLPALPAGSNAIGSVSVSALPNVTVGAALPTGSNTLGAVNVKPATSGGLSTYRKIGLSTTGLNIKASAGQVFGWHLANCGTQPAFVKLFDMSAAPTVGTDVPIATLYVPVGQVREVEFTNGIAFASGIGIGATNSPNDVEMGAPTAGTLIVNVFYK
jgi:hypothetical protein